MGSTSTTVNTNNYGIGDGSRFLVRMNYSDLTSSAVNSSVPITGTTGTSPDNSALRERYAEIDRIAAEKNAADAKKLADAKAAEAKKIADAKAAQAKKDADAKAAHLSGWEILCNAGKGALHAVTGLFTDDKGKFSLTKTLTTVVVGAATVALCAVEIGSFGTLTPVVAAAGVALGGWAVYQSSKAAQAATTKEESERAWQGIGEGTFIAVTSVAGGAAAGALKGAKAVTAAARAIAPLEDALATCAGKGVAQATVDILTGKLGELKLAVKAGDSKKVQSLTKEIAELTEGRPGLEDVHSTIKASTTAAPGKSNPNGKTLSSEQLQPIEAHLNAMLTREGITPEETEAINAALKLIHTPGKEAEGIKAARALAAKTKSHSSPESASTYDQFIIGLREAENALKPEPRPFRTRVSDFGRSTVSGARRRAGNLIENTKRTAITTYHNPVTTTTFVLGTTIAPANIVNGRNTEASAENAAEADGSNTTTSETTIEKQQRDAAAAVEKQANELKLDAARTMAKAVGVPQTVQFFAINNVDKITEMINTQRAKMIADAAKENGVPENIFDKDNETLDTIAQTVSAYKAQKEHDRLLAEIERSTAQNLPALR